MTHAALCRHCGELKGNAVNSRCYYCGEVDAPELVPCSRDPLTHEPAYQVVNRLRRSRLRTYSPVIRQAEDEHRGLSEEARCWFSIVVILAVATAFIVLMARLGGGE